MRYLKKVEAANKQSIDMFIRAVAVSVGNKRYLHDIEKALEAADAAGVDLTSLDYLSRDIKELKTTADTNRKHPWKGGF